MTLLLPWGVLAAQAQEARTWQLDPASSTLYVLVRHDPTTAFAAMGHDHTLAATGWTGTVTWDPADPAACDVHVTVPVGGLLVDPPGMRERAGLPGETPEEDKPKILANAWGPKQLEKDTYPTIEFHSTGCEGDGPAYTVKGTFTLHGVSKTISVPMTITTDEDGFRAAGAFSIAGSAYGFAPYSAPLGVIKNLDRLVFALDVRGR